jgi:hypothetical protein
MKKTTKMITMTPEPVINPPVLLVGCRSRAVTMGETTPERQVQMLLPRRMLV